MFSRYWRSYPWWLQLMLFGLMVFIFLSISQVAALIIIPKATGVALTELTNITAKSSVQTIRAALIFQVISALGLFLLPSLLFANLAHPKPFKYLGLVKPGKAIQPILSIIAMVAATPIFIFIASIVHAIGLGSKADAMQQRIDDLTKVFLDAAPNFGFFTIFLVMAVLPAVSEEIFFRGIFLRFAKKRSSNMIVPIAISSMAFALAHAAPYSFLAIFFAGVTLAIIYNLTGSLWCSMLAHLCYNGFQVFLSYFGRNNESIKNIMDSNNVPISFLLIGGAIAAAAFYLLWKWRTPLPPNWSDDYTAEELSEKGV